MIKILEIENCSECNRYYKDSRLEHPYCKGDLMLKDVPEYGIPSWCPLPDKENKGESK